MNKDKNHTFNTLFVIVLSLMVIFSVSSGGLYSAGDGLEVTIMIYSGKPNPKFTIKNTDKSSIDKINTILSATVVNKARKKGTVIKSRLGYTGIMITNKNKVGELPPAINVYKNEIELVNKEKVYKVDKNQNLEKYLIELAVKNKAISAKEKAFLDKR